MDRIESFANAYLQTEYLEPATEGTKVFKYIGEIFYLGKTKIQRAMYQERDKEKIERRAQYLHTLAPKELANYTGQALRRNGVGIYSVKGNENASIHLAMIAQKKQYDTTVLPCGGGQALYIYPKDKAKGKVADAHFRIWVRLPNGENAVVATPINQIINVLAHDKRIPTA